MGFIASISVLRSLSDTHGWYEVDLFQRLVISAGVSDNRRPSTFFATGREVKIAYFEP
jgi:hypothetical protein